MNASEAVVALEDLISVATSAAREAAIRRGLLNNHRWNTVALANKHPLSGCSRAYPHVRIHACGYTYPLVLERLKEGRLRLHGWWFEIKKAEGVQSST